jgi:2-dehydropantoate 2-reductase
VRIAIMGSGGVGGYYGARLAQAHHDVFFIARGEHAAAMRKDGLRIESELGAVQIQPAAVVTDPREIGTADLVLIAVKLWDTETAARAIAPLVGADTLVVSLQNGIDKDETIAALVGREPVIGGLTYINVVLAAPGVIRHTGKIQRIVVGELAGGSSARAEALAAMLRAAAIDAEATHDVRGAIWEKFVFLAAHSALTAVTRQPIGKVRGHPATRALLADAMHEGVALARAEGVELGDDFVARRMVFIDGLPPQSRASMADDLARGRRLELEWLSGAIVRRADHHRLVTPVHRALYAALVLYADGEPQPESAQG